MATVTKPIALDESINTTEVSPRNVADVLAQELANIATAIGGGGGSGGHTIENSSGTALPQRTNLQFTDGLNATDDSGNDATVVSGSALATKTDIATVESGSTASRAYSVGELVYVNGNLYKVITAISLGSAFTVGTNIQSTNVSDRFADFEKNTLGGAVTITETVYTATTDGYLEFSRGSAETLWRINGTIAYRLAPITGNTDIFLTYLKKGMSVNRASGNGGAKFFPLN